MSAAAAPSASTKQVDTTLEGRADLSEVMNKLLLFTVAMVTLPIGTYFLSRDYVYSPGTSLTYPALSAVVVANGVLGAFIYVAFREDAQDAEREKRARIVSKAGVGKAE
ncbi:hypothetical protein Rhopal_002308-T1 [Rhodotorula paludigena]|uniref:Vacuolar ATPase assembly integral membrane protein VMA21 n=1 Tax=Rhodotorula paludigena TaxID=86838 RepID=A0AAV5GGM3_9BASI|nr:hypothetical protein Rhopal_002308-T1 [Rhodotorula paludigena]